MNNDVNINRRDFLKIASMVAAAVATLPATTLLGARAYAAPLSEEAKLTPAEREVFEKVLKVCLPVSGSSLVDPATLPVIPTVEGALLAGMPPHIRQGLRGGVMYFNDGPKKQFGKTFVQLSDRDATRFMNQWADSSQVPERALATGLKKLTVLAYWAIPNTWAPLGYDGPFSDKAKIASLGNTPEPKA